MAAVAINPSIYNAYWMTQMTIDSSLHFTDWPDSKCVGAAVTGWVL